MTDVVNTEQESQKVWDELVAEREGKTAEVPPAAAKEEPPVVDANTTKTDPENPPAHEPENKDEVKDGVDDPIKEVLARLEKMETRQRKVEGHIGGLTSQQQRIQDAMEAARRAAPAADAPTQGQVNAAAVDPDKWKALKEEFPEWGEATEDLLNARLAGIKAGGISQEEIDRKLEEKLTTMSAALRKEIVDSTLDGVLPGWKDEVKSDGFKDWFKDQPDDIKALAQSDSVRDAARMLRLYDTARSQDPSTKIAQERKQKLANAAAVPRSTTAPKTKSIDDMTPKELWDYEAKLRDERRAKGLI